MSHWVHGCPTRTGGLLHARRQVVLVRADHDVRPARPGGACQGWRVRAGVEDRELAYTHRLHYLVNHPPEQRPAGTVGT